MPEANTLGFARERLVFLSPSGKHACGSGTEVPVLSRSHAR